MTPDANWSTNRNLYHTQHPQTHSIPTPSTTHNYTNTFITTSQKMPQNKLQKKHFAKKCKNKSCRDALPPKNTSTKTQQGRMHTAMHAQTTHTSQRNDLPRSYLPYIFPSTPATIHTTPPYSTAHPILQHTAITINHDTLSPSNHPYHLYQQSLDTS